MSEILKAPDAVKPTTTLDVEGLNCPLPLLLAKKNLARLSTGDILQLNGIRTSFSLDFKEWCERNGHFFLGEKDLHGLKNFFVKKGQQFPLWTQPIEIKQ